MAAKVILMTLIFLILGMAVDDASKEGEELRKIDFKNFKEKMDITKREIEKGRRVEVKDNYIYSYPRYKTVRTAKDLKCTDCETMTRIVANSPDILMAVCPKCGSDRLEYMSAKELKHFEELIK